MRDRSVATITALVLAGVAGPAAGQVTGMPSFNAPYRAFEHHEFGGTLSLGSGAPDGLGLEGQYKFGTGTWDIGIRGGLFDPDGAGDTRVLVGATFRNRIVTHSRDFPLDGAVVLGAGAQFVTDNSRLILPAGFSLGRRLAVEDSDVSIVPYAQPTVFLVFADDPSGDLETDVGFAFGFGADFRLSRNFDARVSIGVGDIEGVAFSAIWLR